MTSKREEQVFGGLQGIISSIWNKQMQKRRLFFPKHCLVWIWHLDLLKLSRESITYWSYNQHTKKWRVGEMENPSSNQIDGSQFYPISCLLVKWHNKFSLLLKFSSGGGGRWVGGIVSCSLKIITDASSTILRLVVILSIVYLHYLLQSSTIQRTHTQHWNRSNKGNKATISPKDSFGKHSFILTQPYKI